jgi:selenocysteine lyase/cysteine desulfurase
MARDIRLAAERKNQALAASALSRVSGVVNDLDAITNSVVAGSSRSSVRAIC